MARPCPTNRTGITRSRRLEPAVESVSDHQSTSDSDDDFDDIGEDVATYISRPPIPEGSSFSSADDSNSDDDDDDNDDDGDELGEEEPEAGVQPEHLATSPADPVNAPPTQDVPPAVPIPTPVPR
ncbi:intraflagellar transport protein 46 homolog [Pecten maximus]|uniref:intraflagellar transport protein 46 homolog n=1 Tax=Pecten maximus TaxID=6579 RepID=UPI001458B11B|nr:intraflagellar transport protein 46 homolog [Pecten maximus]